MDFSDKSSYSWNNKVLTLVVLGILVLVNILSVRIFARFDWTRGEQYSISDSTVDLLQNIDDLVTVKAYFSNDLPPQFLPVKQYVRDILSEYQAYSEGNFSYEFLDPAEKPDIVQEAQRIGVQEVRMQVRENDSFQVKNGYLGLGIFFKGKTEAIPVIQEKDAANLEYDLTSLIIKLTQPKLQVVAFLQGHGEHSINQPVQGVSNPSDITYAIAAQVLRKNYEVKTVDFAKNQTLDGVDVLIVAGAKRDLSQRDIFEIDQHMLKGGKAIFLVDTIQQLDGGINIQPLETNLAKLFEPAGVIVESNLLLDTLAEMANFSEGPGRFFFLQYPPFMRVVSDNFSENAIVAKVQSFVVRFVSSITVSQVDGLTYDRFINTSPASWEQRAPFSVSPTGIPPATPDQTASRAVAVIVSGLFPRLSQEKTVPPLQEWQVSAPAKPGEKQGFELKPVAKDDNRKRDVVTQATSEARLILFADSDFIGDQMIQQDQTSLVVFQNAVDSLTFGEKLISIRSKSLGQVPIKEFDNSTKSLMKFLGILLVPILVTAYGLTRLWVRRKEEKLLKF